MPYIQQTPPVKPVMGFQRGAPLWQRFGDSVPKVFPHSANLPKEGSLYSVQRFGADILTVMNSLEGNFFRGCVGAAQRLHQVLSRGRDAQDTPP